MRFLFYPLALAAATSALLTSCSTSSDVAVLSKSQIHSSASRVLSGSSDITAAAPSAKLSSEAAAKPKDRHGMPVYKFGERTRIARTTAYTHSESDHLIYGSRNALGGNLRYSSKVRSAAADWSFYPAGTTFRIKGEPYLYVVDDYGSALTGTGTIDIYRPSRASMNSWGTRKVEINIVRWGSLDRSAQILSERTGYSHCRQMLSNINRLRNEGGRVAQR